MSQKQAISQTPIDLKPEDEAKPQQRSGQAPAEPGAGSAAETRSKMPGKEPQGGRAPSPRRIQDATVQLPFKFPRAAGGLPRRRSAPRRPRGRISPPMTICRPSAA